MVKKPPIIDEGYSKFWRKNRSTNELTELAFTLKALRKVASHIGRNVRPIYWKGMSEADESSIHLDPSQVKGVYPIPFKKIDRLVGQVVLEAISSMEWTEWVRKNVIKQFCKTPETELRFLESLIDAGEVIYVYKRVLSHPCWPHYLVAYLKNTLQKTFRDPSLPPTPSSLAGVWQRIAILGELPPPLHSYYERPLQILQEYTNFITNLTSTSDPRKRREERVTIYEQMCMEIQRVISEWEKFELNDESSSIKFKEEGAERSEPSDTEEDKQLHKNKETPSDGLDPDLANKVQSLMDDEDTDLTKEVARVVETPDAVSMQTIIRDGVVESQIIPDKIQVKRLRKIFLKQDVFMMRSRKRRMRRGLFQGKVDARRLFRVPIDGRIFKFRDKPNTEHLWNIIIVADASASMGGLSGSIRPWDFAERTFVSLAQASRYSRNHLEIYAYHEKGGQCILTRLLGRRGEIYTVVPGGRTPSGQAIAAAALMLKKKYNKSLIIHITDGASNCGLPLPEAIKYCQKKHIDVVTIGCGCNQQTRDFLKACFPPEKLFFMDHITALATGLERLFKHKILQQ